jgi:hypothetical protein
LQYGNDISRSIRTGKGYKRSDRFSVSGSAYGKTSDENSFRSSARQVALGTMLLGTEIEENKAFSLLNAHACRPGAQIDTARSYASWLPGGNGKSERTIGKWLEKRAGSAGSSSFWGPRDALCPEDITAAGET